MRGRHPSRAVAGRPALNPTLGLEGGVTNGEDVRVTGFMKPIATLIKPPAAAQPSSTLELRLFGPGFDYVFSLARRCGGCGDDCLMERTTSPRKHLRIAAIGDIHVSKSSQGVFHPLFAQISTTADVLLLCGDFTDYGLPEEARILARELTTSVNIPVIAVLGNHDYESGFQDDIRQILLDAGVTVLDGEATEVHGVGFAGAKGFGGGFGRGALGPWGERAIKNFVQEAVDESLKLEAALARLRTNRRIAVLHYSPIRATVDGEPPEIFPYLGSSRLEEPINRYRVSAVFHGHAHRGTAEGRTAVGVPVYNVSMPLLARLNPDRPPYLIVELPLEDDVAHAPAPQPSSPLADPVVKTA